jgi:CheY-like chemotaxis protein
VRSLAARVLRGQGYTVLEAANGEEAMTIAQEPIIKEIHLLLTDVVMPQMGGKELVERFKLLYPGVKILFISGYADKAIAHQALLEPGLPFLEKPFSPTDLAKKVREVLAR